MGILLLRTDTWELKRLARLPGTLNDLTLPWASLTLQFALGHEEEVQKALTAEGEDPADLDDLFSSLARQPAAADLPQMPTLYVGRTVLLASRILGCSVEAKTDTTSPCVELAESILAAFESLLATGLLSSSVIARIPLLTLRVQRADFAAEPFAFEVQDHDGRPHVDVRVPEWNPHVLSLEQQRHLRDRLAQILAEMLAHAFYIDDAERTLLSLIRDERAMERAISFTGSFLTVSAVLGEHPKHTLGDWLTGEDRAYPPRRSEAWHAKADQRSEPTVVPAEPGGSESAAANWRDAKHTDIRVVSLIRPPLWDEAKWLATVFMTIEGDADLPILAPVFRNGDAARMIFRQWRRDIGEVDGEEQIRLSIVRGVSTANPHAYKIVIGSNPEHAFLKPGDGKFTVTISRYNQMDPTSSENLDRFLRSYARLGAYYLLPAVAPGEIQSAEPVFDHSIGKRALRVVDAWEVGKNDLDAVAIHKDDAPIIPPGRENDAPVFTVLKERRSP